MTRHLVVAGATLVVALAAIGAAQVPEVVTPEEAIRAAISERLRMPDVIGLERVQTSVEPEAGLVAEPDVSARLGRPARFFLAANGARRGLAVATVVVRGRYPAAARSIARDEVIGAGAVDFIDGELPALRLRDLLDVTGIRGLEARRDIARGEPLSAAVLRVPPLVRTGDEVAVTVRIGRALITGTGVASGSGRLGDPIRVKPPKSSRLLQGRITGPGAVEIEP